MVSEEELISQLEKKALRVIKQTTHDIPGTTDTYTFYTVYWLENEIMRSETVCIHVNGETKEAYWKDSFPTVLLAMPFRDKVEAEIETFKKDNPKIAVLEILSVNEDKKYAILRAYSEIEPDIEEKKLVAYEKAGKIEFKFLK